MRPPLAELDGCDFDVAVIGAGLNGASAAQHLAAAGYSVLVADKGDFGAGSSSKSSRLLHCGLRYLAPSSSMWDFALHPTKFANALGMAREAVKARHQFVTTAPELAREMKFHFPIYRDGPYARWQVDLAFRILDGLGRGMTPLDYAMLGPAEVATAPLVNRLRAPGTLTGVARFREYTFDWPERVCMDTVLDAVRLGAVARNYTALTGMRRDGELWRLALADAREPDAAATVTAKVVLNMAGIWIDRVNAGAAPGAKRYINGTKGVHVMVQLPPDCAGHGIATLNRVKEPFYCVPWRGMHYFGPTETLYDGDPDEIRPTEEEVAWILDEANHMLPGAALKRSDVLFAWAGVRPLGDHPDYPKGDRTRRVHDLGEAGLPNVFAMTAGPIMTHRTAGPLLTETVADRIAPSGPAASPDYAARRFPENTNAPPLVEHDTSIKLSHVTHAAEHEAAVTLPDLMLRRVGAGWTRTMGHEAAETAARAVAPVLGWDEARIAAEVSDFRAHLREHHLVAGGPDAGDDG